VKEGRRTVVVRIAGGLGNQMFQYAAGLALADRLGGDLLLHAGDHVEGDTRRGFELPRVFTGEFRSASAEDVRKVLGWRSRFGKLLFRRSLAGLWGGRVLVEPHFAYWPAFDEVEDSCYLAGYWQSEQYFSSIADKVRHAFRFVPPDAANREVTARMSMSQSVSVHVRRGDYVSNPKISRFHGVSPLNYYIDAIRLIQERVGDPVFFVFSDDLEWCRGNLPVPRGSVFVDINRGEASFNDMRLMSNCRHHVIANSTFSWWGAWLRGGDGGITIAPKNWFQAEGEDASGIYPPNWIRI